MTTHSSAPAGAGQGAARRLAVTAVFLAVAGCAFGLPPSAFAQAPAAPAGALAPPSAAELEKLVGRIALYPDDLVAIILPASTNPLALVEADRYLDKRKVDPKLPVNAKWDDAVKSLLNYPEVVKMMSGDLDWTTGLGEAVVADQGAVLEAIQVFRRKTQAAGNLKTDKQQVVVVEKEVIRIVPADPQVIYLPQYSPATVVVQGGYSSWGYYPSPYPVYYYPYPPGAAFATGLVWGAAIGAAWTGNHYVTHYGSGGSANININRNVNVGNVNINTGIVGRSPATPSQLPANTATQWKPNTQPGQVSGTTPRTLARRVGYTASGGGAAGATVAPRPAIRPAGGVDAPHAAAQPMGAGPSAVRPAAPAAATGGGAFAGYASGYQAQLDSSRGAASRSSIKGAGARPAPSARAGEGGFRRRAR